MMSLNRSSLIGNVGRDPVLKKVGEAQRSVCTFSIATSYKYKAANGEFEEHTDWHNLVAWGGLADVLAERVKKGDKVYAEGRTQTRKYKDAEGKDRYLTEVVVSGAMLLTAKISEDSGQPVVDCEVFPEGSSSLDYPF